MINALCFCLFTASLNSLATIKSARECLRLLQAISSNSSFFLFFFHTSNLNLTEKILGSHFLKSYRQPAFPGFYFSGGGLYWKIIGNGRGMNYGLIFFCSYLSFQNLINFIIKFLNLTVLNFSSPLKKFCPAPQPTKHQPHGSPLVSL